MRLDQIDVTTIVVDDLKLAIRLTWDEFRKLVSTSKDVTEETADDGLEEMTQALRRHIIGVEGLTDVNADGEEKPVAWQADMVGRLSPQRIMAIYRALCSPGAARQAGDPLA